MKKKKGKKQINKWFLVVVFTLIILITLLTILQQVLPPKYYPLKTECKNTSVPKLLGQFYINMQEINATSDNVITASFIVVSIDNLTQYQYFPEYSYVDCARDLCSIYIDEIAEKCEIIGGGG